MILVNGVAKSGTHAFMALLDTMGLKRMPGTIWAHDLTLSVEGGPWIGDLRTIPHNVYMLGHVPATFDVPHEFKVITIFRDPRNCLVSYCRHRKRVDNRDVSIAEAIVNFWGSPFVRLYESFLGWRGRSVVVRFEDLPPMVVGTGDGIYAAHSQDYNTRTGSPSNWQAIWDEEAEAAWLMHGGPQLLKQAGYT